MIIVVGCLIAGCGKQSIPPTVVETKSQSIGTDEKLIQSVGIETLGGVFTPLLQKGTNVPCSKTEIFSTAADNQVQIMVKLYRGTAKFVTHCDKLGDFQIVGIPPAPRNGAG